MAETRWPRISGWLPRGGLGFVGMVSSSIVLVCSVWAEIDLAVIVAACNLPISLWLAAGLRRDEAEGEVADQYTAKGRGVRLVDILSGQFESERRFSSDMILGSVVAIGIALARYWWA